MQSSGNNPKKNTAVGAGAARILVNGEACETISATDRGLSYGDGLFETIAVSNARPELWGRHMARLHAGCARLNLPAPEPQTLFLEAERLCNGAKACDGLTQGIVKIILTRGSGGRGYRAPEPVVPTRILSFHPFPDYPATYAQDGVALRLCQTRVARQSALAGLKHLNRLENVLARAEWSEADIFEGLMQDDQGLVIEGVMTNVFLVKNGALATPDLSRGGVAGVMRALVLDAAGEKKIPAQVRDIPLDDVLAADEIFLTNSVIGIFPVRQYLTRALSPGALTRVLQNEITRRRAENGADEKA